MHTVKRMEIPTRMTRVYRLVRQVFVPVRIRDSDPPMRPEVVGAQVELGTRGENDVAILQNATESDVICIKKLGPARP